MTSVRDRLADEAAAFSTRLTDLLNGTVTRNARVTSALVAKPNGAVVAIVAPSAKESAPASPAKPMVPLSLAKSAPDRNRSPLWLRLHYRLLLDREREYAAVESSTFGLCVDTKTGRQAIRIEFDRSKTKHPPAHVHIHGHATEIGYAFGSVGKTPPPLEKLHVPVGGLRYRPCLEDFIEFLQGAGLIKEVHPQWRRVLEKSREEFHERQLRAAIRRDPEIAADALMKYGWTVARSEA